MSLVKSLSKQEKEQVKAVVSRLSPRLHKLMGERIAIKARIALLERDLSTLDAKLKPLVDDYGGKVETPDWTASLVSAASQHISKEKLLTLGVKPTIIARATTSKEYTYLKVTVKASVQSDERKDDD
jgi:hypothetical protein